MSRILRNTSGGMAVGSGALAPRSNRPNSAFQVDSWRKSVSKPATYTIQYFIVAGGRSGYNQGNYSSGSGAPGGDGGARQTVTGATVNTGQNYTITVGGGGTGSFVLGGDSVAFGTTVTSGAGGSGGTSSYSGSSLGYGGYGGAGGNAGTDSYGTGAGGGQSGVNGGGDGGYAAGQAGFAGRANSGGGGGGGGGWGGGPGAGGTGTVIIQYLETLDAAESTTGSPTISTSGGYRIYNFTGSGSITF